MYYEIMTKNKHKHTMNLNPYKDDIKQIVEMMMKDHSEKNYEFYNLYKEDFDVFTHGLIHKIHALKTPPVDFENINEATHYVDKMIYMKTAKPKTVIEMMKKI
jgi:hypothetical protein